MSTLTCPKCLQKISEGDLNRDGDLAFCRPCNLVHHLSELPGSAGIDLNIDLSRPPQGAWYRMAGPKTLIGASQRSIPGAIATFAIAGFWNGIVSIFVALAVASTLKHLGMHRPDWLPNPIMNDAPMGVGITLGLWLFLTPFILIGLAMIAAFLSCLGGRTEARISDREVEVFSGIGPLGTRRRFRPDLVKNVRIEEKLIRTKNGTHPKRRILVEFLAGKPLRLGGSLPNERRQFLAAGLRKALVR